MRYVFIYICSTFTPGSLCKHEHDWRKGLPSGHWFAWVTCLRSYSRLNSIYSKLGRRKDKVVSDVTANWNRKPLLHLLLVEGHRIQSRDPSSANCHARFSDAILLHESDREKSLLFPWFFFDRKTDRLCCHWVISWCLTQSGPYDESEHPLNASAIRRKTPWPTETSACSQKKTWFRKREKATQSVRICSFEERCLQNSALTMHL